MPALVRRPSAAQPLSAEERLAKAEAISARWYRAFAALSFTSLAGVSGLLVFWTLALRR